MQVQAMNVMGPPGMLNAPGADPTGECKTLWMGQIQQNWDEAFVASLFEQVAGPVTVKIMRYAGNAAGYAFVDFATHEAAQNALNTLFNQRIPNTTLTYKLNWGSGSGKRSFAGPNEFSLFVGDLPLEVTDQALFDAFSQRYPSCTAGKVVIDNYSGTSKGYGFVRFSDKSQCDAAIVEMNGTTIGGRQVRVSAATPPTRRHSSFHMGMHGGGPMAAMPMAYPQYGMAAYGSAAPAGVDTRLTNGYRATPVNGVLPAPGSPWMKGRPDAGGVPMLMSARTSEESSSPDLSINLGLSLDPAAAMTNSFPTPSSPENTTVFVGNLDPAVTESQLQQHFQAFGNIVQVKIPPNRGCGFVKFDSHDSAEKALMSLNGSMLCNQRIRLDWGKANANRQQHAMMTSVDSMAGYAGYNPYFMNAWPQQYYIRYPQQYMVQAQALMQPNGRYMQDGPFPQSTMPVLAPQMGMEGAQGQMIEEGGLADYGTVNSAMSAAQASAGLAWNGIVQ